MTRIFLSLAVVATIALVANLLVGLLTGDYQTVVKDQITASQEYKRLLKDRGASAVDITTAKEKLYALQKSNQPSHDFIRVHVFLGCAAALATTLVNSIAITYFVGTSRWIKEVVDAYHLNQKLVAHGHRIKRESFAWSVGGILAVVLLVGVGAAADPRGANYTHSAAYVMPHYVLALAVIAFVLLAFWKQWTKIAVNFRLIAEIMTEVQRVKQNRNTDAAAESPA